EEAVRRLIVTTYFPHPQDANRAVFVLNLARALRHRGELAVVSPSPAAPLLGRSKRWRHLGWRFEDEEVDGLLVHRPRFLSIPGLSILSGLTYGLSLGRRLIEDDRRDLVLHGHCAFPDG